MVCPVVRCPLSCDLPAQQLAGLLQFVLEVPHPGFVLFLAYTVVGATASLAASLPVGSYYLLFSAKKQEAL